MVESQSAPLEMTFKDFLELIPPAQEVRIQDLNVSRGYQAGYALNLPDILLHCSSTTCDGTRYFSSVQPEAPAALAESEHRLLEYVCRNCLAEFKTFALWTSYTMGDDNRVGKVRKIGEHPPFGPPIPSRVNKLVGPDRELFLRGRRSEVQGLGIGALAYYRRIVEDQWVRLISEILEVARRVKLPPSQLEALEGARSEQQFRKAVDRAKDAIPESLLIDGHHNPLVLLHKAMSEDIHQGSEERCLELAVAIRTVLYDLAERLGTALRDQADLESAVSRLLKRPGGVAGETS